MRIFFFVLLYVFQIKTVINPLTIWDSCVNYSLFTGVELDFDDSSITTIQSGDIGVSPGTYITGLYNVLDGTVERNTADAQSCAAVVPTIYSSIKSEVCTVTSGNTTISTLTLTPGVYCYTASSVSFFVFSALTLDALGDSSAIWVFKLGM